MFFLVVLAFSFLVVGYFALQNEQLQRRVLASATKSFSQKIESKMDVESLEWNFPNSFVLKNVCIYDQAEDTLLSVERAKVTINILPLFKSTISFRTIQFTKMDARIKEIDAERGTFNFTHIVDAFIDPKDSTNTTWEMDIESLAFTDSRIAMQRANATPCEKGRLNPTNIDLTNISGSLFVRHFSKTGTELRLHKLHVRERSGLELTDLSTTIIADDKSIRLSELSSRLPHSRLSADDALIKFDPNATDKYDFRRARYDVLIDPSHIYLADFAPLIPTLASEDKDLNISGAIDGTIDDFKVRDLEMSYGETMRVDADFDVRHATSLDSLSFIAAFNTISLSADDARKVGQMIIERPVFLPSLCDSLGLISFEGKAEGTITDMSLDGNISTEAGNIFTAVGVKANDTHFNQFDISGLVSTHQFDLAKLFGKQTELGHTSFNLEVDLQRRGENDYFLEADGKIDTLIFKNYVYQGVKLNGKFDDKGFNGNFTLTDDNVSLDFEGNIMLRKEKPVMNFLAHVRDANISNLNFVESEEPIVISFDVQANCTGSGLDDIDGYLSLDNFLYRQSDRYLYLNVFTLNTQQQRDGKKKIRIISDYLNGEVCGKYSFGDLIGNVKRIAYSYAPTLGKIDKSFNPQDIKPLGNDFSLDFTLENTEPINDVIDLPFAMQQKCHLTGHMNDSTDKFNIRIEAPLFMYEDLTVENALLLVENPQDKLKFICRSTYYEPDDRRHPYYISLTSSARQDSLELRLSLSNSGEVTNSATFSANAQLKGYTDEGLSADMTILPSNIVVKDSIWQIHRGDIKLRPKSLSINDFLINNTYQVVHIDGRTTDSRDDSLRIWFTDLELGSISNLLNSTGVTFGGVGDGDFYLTQLFSNPTIEGHLGWYDAYLNEYPFGDMQAEFGYDRQNNTLIFGTDLVSAYETHKKSEIDGAVFFDQDSMFIDGHLRDIDMRFLRKYLDGILSSNTGVLNTHVHALGRFGNLGLEGIGYVRDFGFTVDYTGVRYSMTDTVIMTQNSFKMNNVRITDPNDNEARLTALILHKNFFDWKYAMGITTKNLLAINTTEVDNDLFYGNVYMGGSVGISGTGDNLNIDINARTKADTKVSIPLDGASGVEDASFITFQRSRTLTAQEKRKNRREKVQKIKEEKENTPIDMEVNVALEATPDAQVTMILDRKLGDAIRARGNGNLTMRYTSKDDKFDLYGNYQITKGDYLFTIQGIIARKFDLLEGSTVRWNGDATAAVLDVNAKYSLNAYVGDMLADDNISSTQVNCLMGITGTISRPDVKFDLEMPNIDEDMMRKVRSVINTDEAMNRNVASLLAFGTFNNSESGAPSTSSISNVGFAALSSEISGLLSKINNDVSVGLNYRPYSADQTSSTTEFEVALSTGLLNDRLQLNGNFGYREGLSALDATSYSSGIVDFDIEYKLSKNGRFRSKAFNRSSNSYLRQYNSQTQGAGLIYRQDYDDASELAQSFAMPFRKLAARIKERRTAKKAKP